jgi:protease-4
VIGFNVDDNGFDEGMVGAFKDQLDQALADKHVKAIVVRINSPGGEVVASDDLYRALADARDDTNRVIKIVSCIETVGASGAFYAAMGTDYIVANEMSVTASIGVIMQTLNFGPYDDTNSLMHKLGIKSYTFKSGNLKDILNPTRAPTDEENALVKGLIMEVYDKFVGIVADERNLDLEKLKSGIADGRILSGKQAKDAGLVDDIGYFEDAVDTAKELAKIKDAKVVRYFEPFSLKTLLHFFAKSDAPKLQIQINPNPLKLQAGKMYFLPAYMFQ